MAVQKSWLSSIMHRQRYKAVSDPHGQIKCRSPATARCWYNIYGLGQGLLHPNAHSHTSSCSLSWCILVLDSLWSWKSKCKWPKPCWLQETLPYRSGLSWVSLLVAPLSWMLVIMNHWQNKEQLISMWVTPPLTDCKGEFPRLPYFEFFSRDTLYFLLLVHFPPPPLSIIPVGIVPDHVIQV